LQVLLQGYYYAVSGLMNTTLASKQLLTNEQPFGEMPHNYAGNETLANIPVYMSDWILVEIQSPTGVVLEQRAGLLLQNGMVYDTDLTEGLTFYNLVPNMPYHIIVRSRNHLAAMSADTVNLPNETTYDFRDASQVADNMAVALGNGVYGLLAGDFDKNGIIDNNDFTVYQAAASSVNIYETSDCNADGHVTVSDLNFLIENIGTTAVSAVRY
jgi:hypothetical protein